MKKNIIKRFRCTEKEARILKEKSKLVGLKESELIRLLIKGFYPKEKPDKEFYETVKGLRQVGRNLNQLVAKENSLNFCEKDELRELIGKIYNVVDELEIKYIEVERRDEFGS